MIRSALSKVMWVGRATSAVVGLAILFALAIGVANSALAHTNVDNKLFHLGHSNAASTLSSLVGTVSNGMLQVTNNSTATTATGVGVTNKSAVSPALKATNSGGGPALGLSVGSGKAPLTVNAAAGTATGLSADELDGKNSTAFASAYKRTVVVSPVGTDTENGTALLNALASITDASATKPYLLKIEPGVYDLGNGTLQMKEHVDIEGSGELTTVITSSVTQTNVSAENCPSTVAGANDAELRFLTVRNTGTGGCSVAIQNEHVSTRLTDVTVESTGEGAETLSVGVHNYGGCMTISDATVTASDWGVFSEFSSTGCFHLIKQSKIISSGDYAVYHSASGGTYVAHSQLESPVADEVGGGGFVKCFSSYDENLQAVTGC